MPLCAYIPPYDSKFWNVTNNGYGLEILEQCIVDLYQNLDDFYLIICGDLNTRTGKENYIINDPLLFDKENDDKDELIFDRNSDDGEINLFGRQLLEVGKMYDCVILNGLCQWGFDSSYTFISSSGCSTIDYILISNDLCSGDFVQSFKVFPCIESDHLPVGIVLKLRTESSINYEVKENSKPPSISKLIWNKTKETDFLANFNSDILQDVCTCSGTN